MNDELKEFDDVKFDKHTNPSGPDFDLGQDGQFYFALIKFTQFF
jgi:hypothetical protein